MKKLYALASHEDHCVLAISAASDDNSLGENSVAPNSTVPTYQLSVCNSIGTTVDSKHITLEPIFVCMASNMVFAASRDLVLVWNFRTASAAASGTGGSRSRSGLRGEQMLHVDDSISSGLASSASLSAQTSSQDPICCVAASEKALIVGRESGVIQRYSLPTVALTNRYVTNTKPYKMALNCNST